MIRTVVTVCLLVFGVLYLPVGVQVALFVVALFTIPHRLALFFPAILSDVLYAPVGGVSFNFVMMTLLVAVLLLIHWLIFTQTRVPQIIYGVEKK